MLIVFAYPSHFIFMKAEACGIKTKFYTYTLYFMESADDPMKNLQ